MYIKDMKENNMEATPIKNVFVPDYTSVDNNNKEWLIFSYSENDKPWKWPKVLKYNNKFFYWMSWNSDNNKVNYKEIDEKEIAIPVKRKV
jgi:hypothetical protein